MFLQFLFNKINGLTLLELEKNKQVYCEVLSAIEKIIKFIKKNTNSEYINNMNTAFTVI